MYESMLQMTPASTCCSGGTGGEDAVLSAADEDDPCFPSSALVTKADGMSSRVDALKEGDVIVAATADGALTTDVVSLLSIAMPKATAGSYVALTTTSNATLTLTPEHHLPVGASCCATTKQAKDVAVGETIYQGKAGAPIASTVTKITQVTKQGLHSPVTTRGTYPIVDGFATAFDSATKVHLASYALPLLEATGTTALFRRAFLAAGNKYVKA